MDLLRGLVDQVAIRPIEKGFEIELGGDIAHMVELASCQDQTKKRAALDEAARCSVKVVAGEDSNLRPSGYELDSHRGLTTFGDTDFVDVLLI